MTVQLQKKRDKIKSQALFENKQCICHTSIPWKHFSYNTEEAVSNSKELLHSTMVILKPDTNDREKLRILTLLELLQSANTPLFRITITLEREGDKEMPVKYSKRANSAGIFSIYKAVLGYQWDVLALEGHHLHIISLKNKNKTIHAWVIKHMYFLTGITMHLVQTFKNCWAVKVP